jgi:hypothetical protein
MGDIHIEEFYHDIGLILSRLYASFPRRTIIYVEDIAGEDTPDEYGLHSQRHMSCLGAMAWLKDQKYIDFESLIKQEAIDQAVLTEKSFLILTSQATISLGNEPDIGDMPPYLAQQAISNINLLRNALKSRSAIQISQMVFHIMEQSRRF